MPEDKPEEEGKMKTALELAMERTARFEKEAVETRLTPEQKARVDEVEKEYAAKLAEKEIMLQSKVRDLAQKVGPGEEYYLQAEMMRQVFDKERAALQQEKEARIREIRQKKD